MHKTYDNLADKIAIHLNDTHPVLSIPEMMRLLIDEHQFSWDDAFEVCCQVFSYTNHTLMSEALETWPVDMLGKILPRHLQIIFEINDYFLKTLQEQYPNDTDLLGRASIIDESNGRRVRMAWLAVVVSHKVNGVSELHSNLMVQSLFADFAKIFRSFHQRHQRCDAASLAGGSEPIAFSRVGRTPGPQLAHRP